MTSTLSTPEAAVAVLPATPSTFNLWASVYDAQLNPFLSLEQRILTALLPDLRGLNVLDAGCGTGRLLRLLKSHAPQRLIGVDSSPQMLLHAAEAEARTPDLNQLKPELLLGTCDALPVPSSTIDCLLLSFVASYLPSIEAFAAEALHVTRPNATVWITDIHPSTALAFRWKRSFRIDGEEIEIATSTWSIDDVRAAFLSRGFVETACLTPTFASPEAHIFARADRAASFNTLQPHPAIYLLAFQHPHTKNALPTTELTLTGALCAITSEDAVPTNCIIQNGRFAHLTTAPIPESAPRLDLTHHLLLPGLINAHDHLEFALFPRLGHAPYPNAPYLNAQAWAEDIHLRDADTIALHRTIPRETRLWWGAIRNLLAGVTTVCHHNPVTPEMLAPDFPVRVLEHFRWAHSLAFETDLAAKSATGPLGAPFLIHAAEGTDASSAAEFAHLESLNLIDPHTVLIHGLALSPSDIARLNGANASLVVCPSSNQFLFHHTHTPSLLSQVANLALGSDSPLTALGDLLDEIRFTHTSLNLNPSTLYRMVTTTPASLLHLRNAEGHLRPNAFADLIAIQDRALTPAHTLANLASSDIELVIRSGRIFLASDPLYRTLPSHHTAALEPLTVDGRALWLRAPLASLFASAAPVMHGNTLLLAGKRLTYGHAA
jgi:cytosine/adenosine deaminase-related metal-dependent hydrolase/ubiquinone/menaquinone biosynthesis C-methylase UbiE